MIFVTVHGDLEENEICFIISCNNDSLYNLAQQHIASLRIPEGFKVNILKITGAINIASAYNFAVKNNNSKYKIYLHQDVFIIYPNFIQNLLAIFQKDKSIGVVGMCGADYIPENGVWWECPIRYGKILEYRDTYQYLQFQEVKSEYIEVAAIDGLLIATQYGLVKFSLVVKLVIGLEKNVLLIYSEVKEKVEIFQSIYLRKIQPDIDKRFPYVS